MPPGTVLDTMGLHWAAWRRLAEEYVLQLSVHKLLSLAGELRGRGPACLVFSPDATDTCLHQASARRPGVA